jgi:putative membrane protein
MYFVASRSLFAAHPLATANASLNAVAALLLVAGYVLIKRKQEIAHRNVMLAAFAVSIAFLVCYLVYHIGVMRGRSMPFGGEGIVKYAYYTMLISHIVLAATVPFLAAGNIYLGLADRRYRHRRLARWTFPIWLYVSVTGVLIYWLLYHLYSPATT